MPIIHLDTEAVRDEGRKLDALTTELFENLIAIKSSHAHLSLGWFAEARSSKLLRDLDEWVRKCENKANELQSLTIKLFREVEEWEAADLNGKKNLSAPYPGPAIGLIGPGLILAISDTSGIETDFGLDISEDSNLLGWSTDSKGKKTYDDDGPKVGVEAHVGAEAAVWGQEAKVISETGSASGNLQLGQVEGGLRAGANEDGVYAGVYGGMTLAKAAGTAVLGSALFGFTVGGTVKAGSVEGSITGKAGTDGAYVEAGAGASLVSGQVDIGMNLAGANVGVTAGASVGFEIGIKFGTTTEVALGPFKIGLHIGKAIT